MKKPTTLASFLLLFAIVSTESFAKTEGNYVGLDIIKAKSSYSDKKAIPYYINDDDDTSVGVNYRHAFNLDSIIIAPELFYDDLRLKMIDSYSDQWKVNSRAGLKLNLGYDFTDKFAILANAGVARTDYKVDWRSINSFKKDYSDDLILGIEAKYTIYDNIDLSLKYDTSRVRITEPLPVGATSYDFKIQTTRLGISYKF